MEPAVEGAIRAARDLSKLIIAWGVKGGAAVLLSRRSSLVPALCGGASPLTLTLSPR